MTTYVLTLIDVAGIQEYIFGSNDLGQNIGASEIVALATRDWIFEALNEVSLRHNGDKKSGQWEIEDKSIVGLDAEVIYAGGGNAAIIFKNIDQARRFVTALTITALREAPELNLLCVHEAFVSGGLRSALEKARKRVGEQSEPQPVSTPLLGLGVSATCDFTARPVYALDNEGTPISRAVKAKLDKREAAQDRLWRALRETKGLKSDDWFIRNFDEFGELNESSYIAIIHADGNGMGERIKAISVPDDETHIRELRKFSKSVQVAAQQALQITVETLLATRQSKSGKEYFGLHGEVETRSGRIPFRPIVFGGDDVTFVSDGRLGLALAQIYLNALLTKAYPLSDKTPLYSRAGVAVMKNHYPFSRAYRVAEDLGKEAKQALKPDDRRMALDWHFATSGTLLALDDLRAREYAAQDERSLLMRPIRLQANASDDWRTWSIFRHFTHEFLWNKDTWQGRRNKVKALRDALRAGPDAVGQFLRNYQPPGERHLPQLAGYEALSKTGWEDKPDGRCGYFDAIEATDFFVELEAGA